MPLPTDVQGSQRRERAFPRLSKSETLSIGFAKTDLIQPFVDGGPFRCRRYGACELFLGEMSGLNEVFVMERGCITWIGAGFALERRELMRAEHHKEAFYCQTEYTASHDQRSMVCRKDEVTR